MSLRYLTENNSYKILYSHSEYQARNHPDGYLIGAYLQDKNTLKIIPDSEEYHDNLEKCLMKLGKRLIKKWVKTK